MAWKDTLLDASFRGVVFDCQSVSDSVRRDVQRHAYPYVAGEDTEDLGRAALDISVDAIFWGEDYESRLQKFIQVLEQPGTGELIHPVFGSIEHAQVQSWKIDHAAEDPDSCKVSIQFCQATVAAPLFARQLPEQKAADAKSLARAAQGAGVEAFARRLTVLGGLRGAVNRLNGIRNTVGQVLGAVKGLLRAPLTAVLDVLAFPRVFTSELAAGLRGLIDLRGFEWTNLMPNWRDVRGVFKDTVQLPAGLRTGGVPRAFQAPGAGVVPSPGASVGVDNGTSGTGGANPALFPEDETLITAAVAVVVATELADLASDVLASEARKPSLSPAEIETVVGDVRVLVQEAIDLHRQAYPVEVARTVTEPLRDLALAVQNAGIAVIDARPPLVKRRVNTAMNLHLLAFAWYGDYTRAAELSRLNPGLRHPNFISAGTVLYGYQR